MRPTKRKSGWMPGCCGSSQARQRSCPPERATPNGVYSNLTSRGATSDALLVKEGHNVLVLDDSLCSQLYDEIFRIDEEARPHAPARGSVAFQDVGSLRRQEEPLLDHQQSEEVDEYRCEEGTVAE